MTWMTARAAAIIVFLAVPLCGSACFMCAGGEDEGKAEARQAVFAATRAGLRAADRQERVSKLLETAVSMQNLKMSGDRSASNIPAGTKFVKAEIAPPAHKGDGGDYVYFYLDIPEAYFSGPDFNEHNVGRFGSEFLQALEGEGFAGYFMMARSPKTGEYVSINELIPVEPVKPWEPEPDLASVSMSMQAGLPAVRNLKALPSPANMPVINPPPVSGALSGKTIFINQSHGWFDDFTWSGNRWRVQRGANYGVLEDFDSPEFINYYVLPMLRNAGAKVMTVRESDPNTNMIIVDNSDGVANPSNGTYAETGTWSTSSINGFKQKTAASWTGVTVNPFDQGTGQNRLCNKVSGAPTGTATWTANLPASGYYNVYASWSPFSARARDAQYLVRHSGGETEVRVNQTIDGYTWYLLGNFHFEAGAPASQRQVVLTNSSADASATNVSADAVRWGGGIGDMARHANGVSGRPRWEEEAVIHLQWNGFGYSGTSYTGDDDEAGGWSDRPQYARWEHSQKDGSVEDALYFAWHTNASSDGSARGFSSFRHSTATTDSLNLQYDLHDVIYSHVSNLWIPGWTVRSKNVTDFGENNQSSLGTGLPGVLLEGLFHDNSADAAAYNEPKFRYLVARAITHALIDFYEQRDSIVLTNPPDPPLNFRAVMLGSGQVQLSWDPPVNNSVNPRFGGAATSYRVFRSSNGFGFDNGQTVAGTATIASGIGSGTPTYFRVASVNAGGQSFPGETLAVCDGAAKVLVVNAFDRNQASLVPTETITNAGSNLQRDVPHTFQAFNYVVEHAKSLAPRGVQISSCANECVGNGQVNLAGYSAVFWIGGEESTTDDTFSSTEQAVVSNYLAGSGRSFFVSGAEIAWDLDNLGSGADKAFYNSVLKTAYVGDDAGTYDVTFNAGTPFSGQAAINFSRGAGARYDAEFPDRISPAVGASAFLTYSGGSGGTAGIYASTPNRLVVLGFPFETIGSGAARDTFMTNVWNFFSPPSGIGDWSMY